MKDGYRKMFWGILIATFHITIGIITILPPFVGWIVVLTGLSQVEENANEGELSSLQISGLILFITSLVGGLLSFSGYNHVEMFPLLSYPLLFYPVFLIAVEFLLFHKVLEGAVNHFNAMKCQEIGDKYTGKDRTYIILMGISMVLLTISLTINQEVMFFLGGGMAIISRIYLLTVIRALSKEDYETEDKDQDFDDQKSSDVVSITENT